MTANATRQSHIALRGLLARRRRLGVDASPLLALLAAGLGLWIGRDLGGLLPAMVVERLYFLALALVTPLPMAALGALYHHSLHGALLPWPVDAGQHLRLGLRLLLARALPALGMALGLAIGAGHAMSPAARGAIALFMLAVVGGGLALSAGAAGLCAGAAASRHPLAVAVRASGARGFVSERHAPFLYLPALAFAFAAATGAIAEFSLGTTLSAGLSARALLLLAVPLLVGAATLLVGAAAYRRHALQVIPRVLEEARTIYGGRPAPADPPYGLSLARLLPGVMAAYYRKELREQARGHRGLWPLVVLCALGAALYTINVGASATAAPIAAVVLVVWIATLPTRRTPRQGGAAMLATLPPTPLAAWSGRWLALIFVAAHLSGAIVLALAYRHGRDAALGCAALTVATSLLAVGATMPKRARAAERWSRPARLTAPLALGVGLVALGWPLYGLLSMAVLAAIGVTLGSVR